MGFREILCSGARLGHCRMFSNSLVSTGRKPVPSLHLRQSKCAHTVPRAPGLWEVSVTHRKKVKTTPILVGSELPRHQHSPKYYVPGHHYPSPSRVREVSTEIASRKGRNLGRMLREHSEITKMPKTLIWMLERWLSMYLSKLITPYN